MFLNEKYEKKGKINRREGELKMRSYILLGIFFLIIFWICWILEVKFYPNKEKQFKKYKFIKKSILNRHIKFLGVKKYDKKKK